MLMLLSFASLEKFFSIKVARKAGVLFSLQMKLNQKVKLACAWDEFCFCFAQPYAVACVIYEPERLMKFAPICCFCRVKIIHFQFSLSVLQGNIYFYTRTKKHYLRLQNNNCTVSGKTNDLYMSIQVRAQNLGFHLCFQPSMLMFVMELR